ncbi:MAG: peptidoglycan binding domain-containing protein [Mediterraneibacter faecis]
MEGQKAEATLEECGFDYADVKANVKAAMDYGKSGGLFGRYKSLRKLSKEKVVLSPEYTLDQKATENILEERAVPFAKHAQNATITKSGSGLQINKEEIGETVDKSGIYKSN